MPKTRAFLERAEREKMRRGVSGAEASAAPHDGRHHILELQLLIWLLEHLPHLIGIHTADRAEAILTVHGPIAAGTFPETKAVSILPLCTEPN